MQCKDSDNLNTVQQVWCERIIKEEKAAYGELQASPDGREPSRNRSLGMTFVNQQSDENLHSPRLNNMHMTYQKSSTNQLHAIGNPLNPLNAMTKLKSPLLDAEVIDGPAGKEITAKLTEYDVIKPHRVLGRLRDVKQPKLRSDINQLFLLNSPSSFYQPAPITVRNVNVSLLSSSKRVLPFELNPTKLRRVIDLSPYLSRKQAKIDRQLSKVGEQPRNSSVPPQLRQEQRIHLAALKTIRNRLDIEGIEVRNDRQSTKMEELLLSHVDKLSRTGSSRMYLPDIKPHVEL